jgi:tRNA-dihydrouridine synthase B
VTGARGLMIGRAAIRSPWLFTQIRQYLAGQPVTVPTGRDVWAYVQALWASQAVPDRPERSHCERMKKFLNYVGEGVPGPFLHDIRRVTTAAGFDAICRTHFDHDEPMLLEPASEAAAATAGH